MQRSRVANYHGYMDSHKTEILALIKKGWQQKQIAAILHISAMTLSNYLYFWANGVNRQKSNYISKFKLTDEVTVMQRITSGTRERIGYNTVVNDVRVERPVYQRSFFGESLVRELLDKEIIKEG